MQGLVCAHMSDCGCMGLRLPTPTWALLRNSRNRITTGYAQCTRNKQRESEVFGHPLIHHWHTHPVPVRDAAFLSKAVDAAIVLDGPASHARTLDPLADRAARVPRPHAF